MRLFILPVILLFSAAQPLPANEVVLELGTSESNPRNTEGDFIRLKDGRILFVYTRFTGGSSDNDAAHLASRVSADGGHTWSTEDQTVVARSRGMNVMSVSLLRLPGDRIALFYLEKQSHTDCRPVVRFSTDEAGTWSEPTRIIPDSDAGYFVLNNDRVVRLSTGRLIAPLALHHRPGRDKPDWSGELGVYYSDDGGATWQRSADWRKAHSPAGRRVAAQEPGVVERKDGRLLMYIRTDSGELYRSFSSDQGAHWTDPAPMGVASPLSPATIERVGENGPLVMVWNDHSHLPPAERKLRTPLSLAISRDDGETWSDTRVLESDPNGWYCYTAIEAAPDALLLAYVAGTQEPRRPLSATRIRRIPLDRLPR